MLQFRDAICAPTNQNVPSEALSYVLESYYVESYKPIRFHKESKTSFKNNDAIEFLRTPFN